MQTTTKASMSVRCELEELTAKDLMTENPLSVRSDATVDEAIRFFTTKGISGAVVVSESGRPIGVLSSTDILINLREKTPGGFEPVPTFVQEVMTPAVFNVHPDTPAFQVAEQMVALNVHRLFVVDRANVVVGVISALDMLRHLG